MRNLLSAEGMRLFKNRLFYFLLVFSVLFGAGMQVYIYFGSLRSDMEPRIDNGFFAIAMIVSFLVAVFVSLFVGTEYSDGTMRNKIIHGKSRAGIYCSKWIICSFAMLLLLLAYFAGALSVGLPLNGKFVSSGVSVLTTAAAVYSSACAFVAVFLAIAMNCSKKAVVAVVSLVLTIVLFFVAGYVASMLSEPEYYPECLYMDENGVLRNEPEAPNPNYPRGTKRKVLEIVNDLNPTGQCIQLSGAVNEDGFVCKSGFFLYAGGMILLCTAAGMIMYKKKDIV